MSLIREAFSELYPRKELDKVCTISYSGRFRGYNANIRMTRSEITVSMSKSWKSVSDNIKKGLIQDLLVRLFKEKKHTIHMDLYNSFIKNLSKVATKTESHPVLAASFARVNEQQFNGLMEEPNLKLGNGVNKLGSYEYATDTIMISTILLEHPELLDYVMHHEMLHKKHQFTSRAGRSLHHSAAFKKEEHAYPHSARLERELNQLVHTHRLLRKF